jgi:hypothetical protein
MLVGKNAAIGHIDRSTPPALRREDRAPAFIVMLTW